MQNPDGRNGDHPIPNITTDADLVVWRIEDGRVTRVYLANGSYAVTSDGYWQFESVGNHYAEGSN